MCPIKTEAGPLLKARQAVWCWVCSLAAVAAVSNSPDVVSSCFTSNSLSHALHGSSKTFYDCPSEISGTSASHKKGFHLLWCSICLNWSRYILHLLWMSWGKENQGQNRSQASSQHSLIVLPGLSAFILFKIWESACLFPAECQIPSSFYNTIIA